MVMLYHYKMTYLASEKQGFYNCLSFMKPKWSFKDNLQVKYSLQLGFTICRKAAAVLKFELRS